MKPVITATEASGTSSSRLLIGAHDESSTDASPNLDVVTSPSSHDSNCTAGTPTDRSCAATIRPDMRSPKDTILSRVLVESSPSIATPESVRSQSVRRARISAAYAVSPTPSSAIVASCSSRTAERSTSPVSSALSLAASRLLVVLPIAEQTRCGRTPASTRLATSAQTSRMRSASRTDEPPNFMITLVASPIVTALHRRATWRASWSEAGVPAR
mmetsp:Transcript_28992/g.76857  ORF Transcript_28992/g.76857 Transcript_28992/m.76857 type:complete len:215 (+) Transcript_28992:994-1638(+)